MKATDLMCGDLILVDKRPTRVYGVMERMGRVYDTMTNDISLKRCEPIPLTPEILEKNGWMKVEADGVFYPKQLKGELPWIGYSTNGDSWIFRMRDFCEIKYVHELQHCLKMVGIDKEIVL